MQKLKTIYENIKAFVVKRKLLVVSMLSFMAGVITTLVIL